MLAQGDRPGTDNKTKPHTNKKQKPLTPKCRVSAQIVVNMLKNIVCFFLPVLTFLQLTLANQLKGESCVARQLIQGSQLVSQPASLTAALVHPSHYVISQWLCYENIIYLGSFGPCSQIARLLSVLQYSTSRETVQLFSLLNENVDLPCPISMRTREVLGQTVGYCYNCVDGV